jgi:phenylpyruvate tautomerase PptA (4-oxalocrotonate tautomerase family)
MPNILVKVPQGAFPGDSRAQLLHHITEAAARAERIPADPRKRFTTWVVIEEVGAGLWSCGGLDLSAQVLPCIAVVHVPGGVLDEASRALYVKLMHEAFGQALPPGDRRQLATSVILHDVPDGAWGGNGTVWTLPILAKAAGYAHLQHLVAGTSR